MKKLATMIAFLLILLSAICPARAYVYYVEVEDFDPVNSVTSAGGGSWTEVADGSAFGEKYMQYAGPHAQANTSLLYPLPEVDANAGQLVIWLRCLMPDGGANSYFLYVSTDGGNGWGAQQVVSGAESPDWKWESWAPTTPFVEGDGNVLRLAEREDGRADLLCIRNDGATPSADDYASWLEAQELSQSAVEPTHKIATTWGRTKSAY